MNELQEAAQRTRMAARLLAASSGEARFAALEGMARALEEHQREIEAANQLDLVRAERESLAMPLVKRLSFPRKKIEEAARSIRAVAALEDPLNRKLEHRELDDGLILSRITTPIGVIGMIFESRPDALVQIAALALKSGNGVVLKGGSEALETNRVLAEVLQGATESAGIPDGWMHLIETRRDVRYMLELDNEIDLIIPRGSNQFVRYIMDNTRIPVMGHADGICHVYLHEDADPAMARDIVVDSKTQYVAVCNAMETLLVHERCAPALLPAVGAALGEKGVELRGCAGVRAVLPGVAAATEEDWQTEYLDLILSIRVVSGVEEAVEHINRYGSGHTDAIVTASPEVARQFIGSVDSASVMWNASTRFADGYRYGLGAEVGVSTSRIHARGPVGLSGLLSSKWVVAGGGHVVATYESRERQFTHREL